MRFNIDHLTRYRYSKPVEFDRHLLRLTPRCDARQHLVSQNLQISPKPTHHYQYVDAWGNAVSLASFSGTSDILELRVRMEVQTTASTALSLITDEMNLTISPEYGSETRALAAYLEPIESSSIMQEFTQDLRLGCQNRLIPLLDALNRRVSKFRDNEVRLEGPARTPAETLQLQSGVCRDLAVLFIAACRHLGIAARFVSGYQMHPASGQRDKRYLHAWADVYLPGLGWQGYDQTHGAPVSDAHVVVACGATQDVTMPVEGSILFTGDPPESTLVTDMRIFS